MDATKPDAAIGGYAHEAGRSVVVVVNKWDLIEKDTYTADRFIKDIRSAYPLLAHVPVVLTSALTRQRTQRALDVALQVYQHSRERVATSQLNSLIEGLKSRNPPPIRGGRQAKLLYCTQHGTEPPSFVCFCSDPGLIGKTYLRYLENRIRSTFPFPEVPIRLVLRERRQSK